MTQINSRARTYAAFSMIKMNFEVDEYLMGHSVGRTKIFHPQTFLFCNENQRWMIDDEKERVKGLFASLKFQGWLTHHNCNAYRGDLSFKNGTKFKHGVQRVAKVKIVVGWVRCVWLPLLLPVSPLHEYYKALETRHIHSYTPHSFFITKLNTKCTTKFHSFAPGVDRDWYLTS
jgi:hypothetical protein